MHNNYYFLKHLAPALDKRLKGAELIACFSQNKNELIFSFGPDHPLIIKAHLKPSFCCLSFPDQFHRARKNSVDLFTSITGKKVEQVHVQLNERCLSMRFKSGEHLIFKMHGNRSNIILSVNNEIVEVFKKGLKNDFNLIPDQLDRSIAQTKEAFLLSKGNLKALFPTFGPLLTAYLNETWFNERHFDGQWELVQQLLTSLESRNFYIVNWNGSLHLSLVRLGPVVSEFQDPIKAINTFFLEKITTDTFHAERHTILTTLNEEIKKTEGYIQNTSKKLDQINDAISYAQLGDLIMAHLHEIPQAAKTATLPNFYDNNVPVTIKLKQDLSAQKNAEIYYRKSKNQSKETDVLTHNIARKKIQLDELIKRKDLVEHATSLKELRALDIKKEFNVKKEKALPYRTVHFEGYEFRVGKSARNNDEMLREYAHKEDLWLHAKDISGSHVLIKNQQGKAIPAFVIERAAELAAFYSKRKNDTLCPVVYTQRKYVRKRKGDPPGAVVVDREKTILVAPTPDRH